jgi:hypothetical protein
MFQFLCKFSHSIFNQRLYFFFFFKKKTLFDSNIFLFNILESMADIDFVPRLHGSVLIEAGDLF